MPTWGQILKEIRALPQDGRPSAFDVVRRKYLSRLFTHTGRNTIIYATAWTQPGITHPDTISISDEDVHGFMEVLSGLRGDSLDLILHSPGGSAEAAEAVVSYVRSKFSDVRVVVPQAAMSAATMIACSANSIVMGKHSSLGPIDPQMILETPLGVQAVPAQSILDQFAKAQDQCRDPELLASWVPMLSQYGPALLVDCENALHLSRELVAEWLERYMFAGQADAKERAEVVANALADHTAFKSHGRHINREAARALGKTGLRIEDLEEDQTFQDLVLSVYHAASHTFNGTKAQKIIENHNGRAYVRTAQLMLVGEPEDGESSAGKGKKGRQKGGRRGPRKGR